MSGYRNFKRHFSRFLNVSDAALAVTDAHIHGNPAAFSASQTIEAPIAPAVHPIRAMTRARAERLHRPCPNPVRIYPSSRLQQITPHGRCARGWLRGQPKMGEDEYGIFSRVGSSTGAALQTLSPGMAHLMAICDGLSWEKS